MTKKDESTAPSETQMVASIIEHVKTARNQWFDEHDEQGIKEKVYEQLDGSEKEVFQKLLGFDKSWGGNKGWKVDHCNGRNGNSVVGDYIKSAHTKSVYTWIDEQVGGIDNITLPKSAITSMKKEILEHHARRFRQAVHDALDERMERDAKALVDTIMDKCVDVKNQQDTIKFAFELIENLDSTD